MANFSENFRGASGPQVCPLCKTHLDSQNLSFQCPLVKENVKIEGQYYTIFTDNTDTKLVNTLVNVTKFRDEYIQSRKIKLKLKSKLPTLGHGAPVYIQMSTELLQITMMSPIVINCCNLT